MRFISFERFVLFFICYFTYITVVGTYISTRLHRNIRIIFIGIYIDVWCIPTAAELNRSFDIYAHNNIRTHYTGYKCINKNDKYIIYV